MNAIKEHPVTEEVKEVFLQVRQLYGPGVQLKYIHGHWHGHKYRTVWDKEKKKPRKVFEAYLGVIKEGKVVPARRRHKKRKKGAVLKQNQLTKPVMEIRHAGWENEPSYV